MRKITVNVLGKSFDISLEDKFASKIESELKEVLKQRDDQTSEAYSILFAYIEKSYELYKKEQELERMIKKLDLLK